jgi:hypothetical protein
MPINGNSIYSTYGLIVYRAVSRAFGVLRVVVPRREPEKDPVLLRVSGPAEV